jgi:Protein of unknown function (DUF3800)
MDKTKFYCFVDESGQDTEGRLFVVSVVVTGKERREIAKYLERIENDTEKRATKWKNTHIKRKIAYIERIVNSDVFKGKLFYHLSKNTRSYKEATILTVASAINAAKHSESYKASIFVDGLSESKIPLFSAELRKLGISTEKVRGPRDESDAIIRLADAIAGFTREYIEGAVYAQDLYRIGVKSGIFKEL